MRLYLSCAGGLCLCLAALACAESADAKEPAAELAGVESVRVLLDASARLQSLGERNAARELRGQALHRLQAERIRFQSALHELELLQAAHEDQLPQFRIDVLLLEATLLSRDEFERIASSQGGQLISAVGVRSDVAARAMRLPATATDSDLGRQMFDAGANVTILSRPTIATREGQEAVLQIRKSGDFLFGIQTVPRRKGATQLEEDVQELEFKLTAFEADDGLIRLEVAAEGKGIPIPPALLGRAKPNPAPEPALMDVSSCPCAYVVPAGELLVVPGLLQWAGNDFSTDQPQVILCARIRRTE